MCLKLSTKRQIFTPQKESFLTFFARWRYFCMLICNIIFWYISLLRNCVC